MQTFSLKSRWRSAASVFAGASVDVFEDSITVDFAVKESPACFRREKEKDGDAVCQDSCVEVFLNMFDKSGRYANFEFNSKGVCYAARGEGRQNRTELSEEEYAKIIRKAGGVSMEGDFYRWTLSVQIPKELLGVEQGDLRVFQIEGNLCKCADLAEEPHWLTAFPIKTEKPDFHRPECFDNLNCPSWNRYGQ